MSKLLRISRLTLPFAIFLSIFVPISHAFAAATELGISYGQKKTSFDQDNYDQQESTTGSLSIYFLDRVAFELSYTDAMAIRSQTVAGNLELTTQKTKVYGADLIWVLTDRTAFFQPYLKGGIARLDRQKNVKVNNLLTQELDPDTATVPSYGVGFKLAFTDSFGLKVAYDVWHTPIGNNTYTDDDQLKVGLTWMIIP